MKHTAVYVRVSTQGQHLENQIPDLQRWAIANGIDYPTTNEWIQKMEPWKGKLSIWYPDKFSGRSTSRPGWGRLMYAFNKGEVTKIVAWRIDRLGRRSGSLCGLFETCKERGVNLITLRDGVDLETPAGRMIAGVLASLAQFEAESIRERLSASLDRTRELQRRAHEMRNQGKTLEEIGRALREPIEVVERMLQRPSGKLWYGGRKRGMGKLKRVTNERVAELLAKGLGPKEVAKVLECNWRTIYRRLYEIKAQAVVDYDLQEAAEKDQSPGVRL